jgi:hypothetical protein
VPLALYLGAVVAEATKIGVSFRSPRAGLLAARLIVVQHALYGVGFLVGLVRRPRHPHRSPSPNWADHVDTHADDALARADRP